MWTKLAHNIWNYMTDDGEYRITWGKEGPGRAARLSFYPNDVTASTHLIYPTVTAAMARVGAQ